MKQSIKVTVKSPNKPKGGKGGRVVGRGGKVKSIKVAKR